MSSRRRLKTTSDVRRYLASLVNRVEDGTLEPEKAGKLTYIANSILNVIRAESESVGCERDTEKVLKAFSISS